MIVVYSRDRKMVRLTSKIEIYYNVTTGGGKQPRALSVVCHKNDIVSLHSFIATGIHVIYVLVE